MKMPGCLSHTMLMTTNTSSSNLRLLQAVRLWHNVTYLQQEIALQSQEAANIQEVKRSVQVVENIPEIDAERIASLQAQIQSGSYQIDNEVLAQKMFGIVSLLEWNVPEQE